MMSAVLPNDWSGVPQAQAGWVGLVVILLLGLAVVFLYKSMTKQLKKIPPSFDEPADRDESTKTPPPWSSSVPRRSRLTFPRRFFSASRASVADRVGRV